MTADLEIVTRWFGKSRDTCANQGRHEAALLWSDGLGHLIAMNDRSEKAEARVAELEKALAHSMTAVEQRDRYREALEKIRSVVGVNATAVRLASDALTEPVEIPLGFAGHPLVPLVSRKPKV